MVRDAYPAGGEQSLAADDTPDQTLDIRLNASNLTQELAQLLAASIAQGQASRRVGNPTGSELASLAALVSAAQSQRGLSTGFKDGLSSLSYTPPPQLQAYAPPAPQHQSYAPPAPQHQTYAPPAPQHQTYAPPAPQHQTYAPPAPQHQTYAPPAPAPMANSPVQFTEQHDDEPMPIPSTWRQPTVSDDDRWYRQQLGAAVLGLVAGLMVVVPAVLWLSGWLGGPSRSATTRQAVASYNAPETIKAPAEVKTVKVRPADKTEVASQYVTATVEPRMPAPEVAPPPVEAPPPANVPIANVAATPPVTVQVAPVAAPVPPVTVIASAPPVPKNEPSPRSRVEELLAQAERLIENGDIMAARGMLAGNEGAISGPVSGSLVFALAETYDPNMLAAWGTRGVAADVTKAKSLYGKARDLGIARAQMRLEQLR